MDDFSADINTSGVLQTDNFSLAEGNLDFSGDEDWFAITITETQTLLFGLVGIDFSDAHISLYDANGAFLTESTDSGVILQTLTYDFDVGTFYVSASASGGTSTGAYEFEVVEIEQNGVEQPAPPTSNENESSSERDLGDFSADTSTLATIVLDDSGRASASMADDIDWWFFDATAGQTVNFLTDFDNPFLNQIAIFDENGNEVVRGEASSFQSALSYTFSTSGGYYIEVVTDVDSDTYFSGGANQYQLHAELAENDDFAADITTTGIIPTDGSTTRGELENPGDQDWFQFTLTEASQITLGTFSGVSGFGFIGPSDFQVDFAIYDASGTLVAESDRINNLNLLDFVAPSAGDYYFSVRSLEARELGAYDVSINVTPSSDGGDDFSANIFTFGTHIIGGPDITGVVNFDRDTDWFAFTGTAGDIITFFAQSDAIGASRPDLEVRPRLGIFDEEGNPFPGTSVSTIDNIMNGTISTTVSIEETGTYYVGFSGSRFDDGAYTISSTLIVDEAGNSTDTAAALPLDNSIVESGLQFSGDRDFYEFEIEENNSVVAFTLTSDDFLGLQVLNLQLRDENGIITDSVTVSPEYDSATDSFFYNQFFENAGTYHANFSDNGGRVFDYDLQAQLVEDDYGNTVESASQISTSDTIEGGLQYTNDLDFFEINITEPDNILIYVETVDNSFVAPIVDLHDEFGDLIFTQTIIDGFTSDAYFSILDFPEAGNFYLSVQSAVNLLFFDHDVVGDYIFSTISISNEEIDTLGTLGDDSLIGTPANDTLLSLLGADTLNGLEGSDVLTGGSGDDLLYGDSAHSLSLTSYEGQLYRAYQAVFDRSPDAAGFNAFLTEMRLGNLGEDSAEAPFTQQEAVITQFVESVEFQNTYGELTNRDFMEQLYLNVLERPGNISGVNAFTAALDAGRSRAEVVVEFANSAEFVNLMTLQSAAFASNVTIHPAEAQVFRIYQAVFQRDPDEGGFTAFTNSIQADVLTVEQITAEFVASPEFQATYGALSNADFVELLFTNVLPGNTDQQGRADFTESLDDESLTRAEMVAEFVESFEFVQRMAEPAAEFVAGIFSNSSDTLDGGTGNDILFGGRGEDEFVFDTNDGDMDIILDFTAGTDSIDLGDNAVFDSFAEIIAAGAQVGLDTVFDFGGGNTLTLDNIVITDLTGDDFGLGDEAMAANDVIVDVLI